MPGSCIKIVHSVQTLERSGYIAGPPLSEKRPAAHGGFYDRYQQYGKDVAALEASGACAAHRPAGRADLGDVVHPKPASAGGQGGAAPHPGKFRLGGGPGPEAPGPEEILERAHDRSAAEEDLREALPELREIALETVAAQGYDYDVTAELTDAAFPTREYDGFTLPAGEYLALRLVIGAGEGHNWWCVVFPPLCAQTTTDVAQTAMAAGLDGGDVSLLTEESQGYVLKFKSIELWEGLRQRFG